MRFEVSLSMNANIHVKKALFRALLSLSRQLSAEIARHKTADIFPAKEAAWLQETLPGAIAVMRQGERRMKEYVREEFRLKYDRGISEEEVERKVDVGFSALSLLNQRIAKLKEHAVDAFSDVVTHGIRVSVKSEKKVSVSQHFGHVYSYRIRITNEEVDEPVQLVSRHWTITDSEGTVQEVIGPGVRGEQPILEKGEVHEYGSYAILQASKGTMRGSFSMLGQSSGEFFDVQVAPFALVP